MQNSIETTKEQLEQVLADTQRKLLEIREAKADAINAEPVKKCFKDRSFHHQYEVMEYSIVTRAHPERLEGHRFYRHGDDIVIRFNCTLNITLAGYDGGQWSYKGHGEISREEFLEAWGSLCATVNSMEF